MFSVPEKTSLLDKKARELGFDWVAVAQAQELSSSLTYFQQWLEKGHHGDMEWLARDPQRRGDPRKVVEGCRSVVVLGVNYLQEPLGVEKPLSSGAGRVSKYARTRDYHRVIEKMLRKLARYLDTEVEPGATSRGYVDYGPVMERDWAVKAGLGFIGKNTLLINPEEGSCFFLSALLTTAELEVNQVGPSTLFSGCGDCKKCLDACPTGALTGPGEMDARRCISYLTIEKKGAVDREFWDKFSGFFFGCDICQDVCPYNIKRSKSINDSVLGEYLVPGEVDLAQVIESPEKFLEQFEGTSSPLKRAGVESLLRNALLAAYATQDEQVLQLAREVCKNERFSDKIRDLACCLVGKDVS